MAEQLNASPEYNPTSGITFRRLLNDKGFATISTAAKAILAELAMTCHLRKTPSDNTSVKRDFNAGECVVALQSLSDTLQPFTVPQIRAAIDELYAHGFISFSITADNIRIVRLSPEYFGVAKGIHGPAIMEFTDKHLALAEQLYAYIMENHPYLKAKEKPDLSSWANEIRLMEQIDKLTEKQIEALIWYSQRKSEFWKKNIRSADKLRKHHETLIIQFKEWRKNRAEQLRREKFGDGNDKDTTDTPSDDNAHYRKTL